MDEFQIVGWLVVLVCGGCSFFVLFLGVWVWHVEIEFGILILAIGLFMIAVCADLIRLVLGGGTYGKE